MQKKQRSVAFMGTSEFAVPTLKRLLEMPEVSVEVVVTQPDRPSGRGNRLVAPPIKSLIAECSANQHIKVFQPEKLRQAKDLLEDFQNLDACIVVSYGQIIPKWLLTSNCRTWLNIHSSLLPRWRGAAPMQRALMAGDVETGVCLMKVEQGLDTGAVYAQTHYQIPPNETCEELQSQLADLGADLIERHLEAILLGELLPVPQSEAGMTYATKIEKEEANINWGEPRDKVHNLIRGLSSHPGAFTYLGAKRLKILKSSLLTPPAISSLETGCPGKVLVDHTHKSTPKMFVQCGDGFIEVLTAQLEGKPPASSADFVRGHLAIEQTILSQTSPK